MTLTKLPKSYLPFLLIIFPLFLFNTPYPTHTHTLTRGLKSMLILPAKPLVNACTFTTYIEPSILSLFASHNYSILMAGWLAWCDIGTVCDRSFMASCCLVPVFLLVQLLWCVGNRKMQRYYKKMVFVISLFPALSRSCTPPPPPPPPFLRK